MEHILFSRSNHPHENVRKKQHPNRDCANGRNDCPTCGSECNFRVYVGSFVKIHRARVPVAVLSLSLSLECIFVCIFVCPLVGGPSRTARSWTWRVLGVRWKFRTEMSPREIPNGRRARQRPHSSVVPLTRFNGLSKHQRIYFSEIFRRRKTAKLRS